MRDCNGVIPAHFLTYVLLCEFYAFSPNDSFHDVITIFFQKIQNNVFCKPYVYAHGFVLLLSEISNCFCLGDNRKACVQRYGKTLFTV